MQPGILDLDVIGEFRADSRGKRLVIASNGFIHDVADHMWGITYHCEIVETGNESWHFKNRA